MCMYHSPYVANKNLLGKIEEIIIDVTYKEGANDYIYYIYIYIDDGLTPYLLDSFN